MAIGLSDPGQHYRVPLQEQSTIISCKPLKSIALLPLFFLLAGCGSQAIVPPAHDEMIQLEEKNARLEAELTELREKILAEERSTKAACAPKQSPTVVRDQDINKQKPELGELADEAPELAVVTLAPNPDIDDAEADADFGQNRSSPGAANSEEPIDESTRPVLKVHGRHEARVYHRLLDAADGPAQ